MGKKCLNDWAQKVVMGHTVPGGQWQVGNLGSVLFNGPGTWIRRWNILSGSCKMSSNWWEYFDTHQDWATFQRDSENLEKWTSRNPMKFKKYNCPVLHIRKKSPLQQYRLGTHCLEISSVANAWGQTRNEPWQPQRPTVCWAV